MIKTKLTITLLLFFFIAASSFAHKADEIIGKYRLPNKLHVEIFKEDGKYHGKIIALRGFEQGQITDINNPDETKQKNPLIGMQIINDLEYNSKENRWINGHMYGPEKGMTFQLKVIEMREKEIVVVGSKLVFWKTLVWEKI
ncbi:MAG: hypothetical protein B7C24_04970 [Bacteroidetes bacterium 4572_77]|nr:MAG: hypothetical protein B7C24_04970 [Bacteroidetes bacterium 4572_77]